MTPGKILTAVAVAVTLVSAPSIANAQARGRSAPVTGHAVARPGPPPRAGHSTYVRPVPYGRYYYPYYPYSPYRYAPYPYYYGPGFSVGLSLGYGYPGYYAPYAPYAYGGYAPYPYYAAPYVGYGYAGHAYGGVRIDVPQKDAEVYADGYFAGIVDNYDGTLQQLNLEPGNHRIEVRAPGFQTASFEVYVEPGKTITYRTALRPAQQ